MKEENLSEKRHYELSFWFSAQLDESAVEQKSNTLVRNIEEKGGIVTFNQLPQLKQLAYPIKKERSGYFGYLKFNLPAEKVKELKEKLDFDKDILRYLIITIPEEEEKEKLPKKRKPSFPKNRAATSKTEREVPREKISMEELDKKLDEILQKGGG